LDYLLNLFKIRFFGNLCRIFCYLKNNQITYNYVFALIIKYDYYLHKKIRFFIIFFSLARNWLIANVAFTGTVSPANSTICQGNLKTAIAR